MKTLGLAMIVKNEEKIIERCLTSVKDIIDLIIICDTGSTDSTIDIIKNFAESNKILCEIYHVPWKNFGWNRTELLKLSRYKTDYLLLLDSDEQIEIKNFNKEKLTNKAYYLRHSGGLDYAQILLINNHIEWYYKGVTHEYIDTKEEVKVETLDSIIIHDYSDGSNRKNKSKKDVELLLQGLKEEPNSPRYHFYLAQTYKEMGQYEKAINYYLKRIDLGGWDEEIYYSIYSIGYCKEQLKDIAGAKDYYLKAWEYRPTRAESLFRLTQLCRCNKEYQQGYMFAKKGLEIPYPKDILFINKDIYDYELLFEKSICSYHVGKIQEAYDECKKLMTLNLPENYRNQNRENIQFSERKLFGKINTLQFNKSRAKQILQEINGIFVELNSKYFIMAGTLLGIIREKDFLPNEEDMDIGVFGDEKIEEIITLFINKGFTYANKFGERGKSLEVRFFKDGIQLDIFFFYNHRNKIYCSVFDSDGTDYRLTFDKFGIIKIPFEDIIVSIPEDPEKYLITQYGGNWKIPKRKWDYIKSPKNIARMTQFSFLTEEEKEQQVKEIKELETLFKKEFNLQLHPIYGTLLGIIRDGDFISHDCDIDLSYISDYHTINEVREELNRICTRLKNLELLAKKFTFNGQLHVWSPSKKHKIDIWTAWIMDGKYYLTYTVDGQIKEEDVLPLKSITFKNQELLIPQTPEKIFEFLYVDWKKPLKNDFAKAEWVFRLYKEK
jgi:phosphorylcholine metabolism protein LicD